MTDMTGSPPSPTAQEARGAGSHAAGSESAGASIRIVLPAHLRTLARVDGEISVRVAGEVTHRAVLDALEETYPMLRGTIRDHGGGSRRAFVRFFACEEDLSNQSPDTPLPERVVTGAEPYMIIGAMAGG